MAHQIDESKPKYLSQTRFMSGRRIIKTSVTEITDENVVDVLRKALATHDLNRSEIDYLWKYYRGDQPIRNRVKDVRPEICNKITENRANEIVSFKVGYLCGEPIQYVSRNGGEEIVKQINTLNEYMFAEDKAAQDQELVEWQMICGTAFRLVLPDEPGEEDEAPFELYTLDPRDTFVVYSNEIGNKPLMAVKYSKDDNEIFHYSIYTENHYYLVDGDILVESKPHALDMIPIIEYPGNNARLGSFEIVLPLLDAINNVESNRMDGRDSTLVKSYRKAEELRKERVNQEMWLQGMYIYDAISRLSPILRAFAKKGTKAQPYVEEAYPINKKTVEEAELKKEKAKSEKGLRYMQAYMVQANKQLQERK